MLVDVLNLENKPVDKLEFSDDIVSTPVYIDIIKRVIDWQLLKRMRGTHKTKTVSEVSGTTKKPYKQKVLVMHVKVH
jgi:large subunit ribosomal protein L4